MSVKKLNEKEQALWLTNHEGITRYVSGELSYQALQDYKLKLAGASKFTSMAHQSTVQKLSGHVLSVAELKRHFTLSQLRTLRFA
jgi:hypothetical protein